MVIVMKAAYPPQFGELYLPGYGSKQGSMVEAGREEDNKRERKEDIRGGSMMDQNHVAKRNHK